MKIFVTVKPGAKQEKLEAVDATHFRVWVKAPPADGKANVAVLKALSRHLKIPKSHFSVCSGASSRAKVIEIR